MNLAKEQQLFTQDVVKLLMYIYETGGQVTLGEAYRTKEQQKIYFDTGLSKTMKSKHLDKKAIDLNIFINGRLTYKKDDLEHIGYYWESLSPQNEWGGFWKFRDTPHFQRN